MAGDQYGREKKKAMVGWISCSHYDDPEFEDDDADSSVDVDDNEPV